VPSELRSTVDTWWRAKLDQRHGFEALQEKVAQLGDPAPLEAFLRFGRSLLPHAQREQVSDWLMKHGAKVPRPREDFLGSTAATSS
jgi:hypothetical protein